MIGRCVSVEHPHAVQSPPPPPRATLRLASSSNVARDSRDAWCRSLHQYQPIGVAVDETRRSGRLRCARSTGPLYLVGGLGLGTSCASARLPYIVLTPPWSSACPHPRHTQHTHTHIPCVSLLIKITRHFFFETYRPHRGIVTFTPHVLFAGVLSSSGPCSGATYGRL